MAIKRFETLDGLGTTGAAVVSNTLTVSSNLVVNSDTLFVDTVSGRVGIGTASPNTTLEVIGGITAASFVGDGSGLTGVGANDAATLDGLTANDFVQVASNSTIQNSRLTLTNSNVLVSSGYIRLLNDQKLHFGNLDNPGNQLFFNAANNELIVAGSNIRTSNTITANAFVGDGSGLTNVAKDVFESDTLPVGAAAGDMWFNTNDTSLNYYYDDGNSTQWVAVSGPAGADASETNAIATDTSSATILYPLMVDQVGVSETIFASTTNFEFNANSGALTVDHYVGNTVTVDNVVSDTVTSNTVTATDFNTTSDERLKDNIATIQTALDVINNVRPVSFDWKETSRPSFGVIAQELNYILPQAVNETANGHLSVAYDMLIPFLVRSVQELATEVERLKNGS